MRRLLVALVLGLSLAGCTGGLAPPTPTSIYPLDKAKLTAAEMNMKTDPELATCGLTATAKNDVLVISGEVHSDAAKKRAEDLARRTEGIHKVENQIKVVVDPNAPKSPIL